MVNTKQCDGMMNTVQGVTAGAFAAGEGGSQLVLDESVIEVIASSSEAAAAIVSLVVFLAGATYVYAKLQPYVPT